MAYKIHPDEDLPEAIRRCAREQLERAELALNEEARHDPIKAVHSARKAIKKERSLLRLAREPLPDQTRRITNRRLRAVARGLSGARDSEVVVQTFDALAERYAGQLPARGFATARKRIKTGSASVSRPGAEHQPALDELAAIRVEVDDWKLTGKDWSAVEAGLLRTYRAARSAMTLAKREASDENLHTWRKRTKDVWYHLRLLAPVCGPVAAGQSEQADRLTDLLGDDHDLATLRVRLVELGDGLIEREALLGLIDHRRGELQAEARFAGERLFAERPGAFRRRMRSSWRAGRAEARSVLRRRPVVLSRTARA